MRVFFTAIPSIIACVALFFIVMGTREWMLAVESTKWPTVEGTVLSSSVSESRHGRKSGRRTDYFPKIEYAYTVDGVNYTGSKVSFKTTSPSRASAEEIVQAHPAQSRCAIAYDPSDPTRSVLVPGADWMSVIPVGIGVFSLAFSAVFIWLALKITRRMLLELGAIAPAPSPSATSDPLHPPRFGA